MNNISKSLISGIILFFFSLSIAYLVSDIIQKNNKVGSRDSVIVKDSIIKDTVYIPTSDILYIVRDKVELKIEPSMNATTIDFLEKGSIYYIVEKSQLEKVVINRKPVEDFWFKIKDSNDLSGWVFGFYTSKAIK